jgi:Cd2+/Zn2+-exporting ATPase
MNKKQKKTLYRIIIAGIIFVGAKVVPFQDNLKYMLPIYLIGYLIIGSDIVIKAIKNITKGQVFDENFLMSIATIGAFALGDYSESMAVMLFYQVGELFQSYAVNKSRKSISSLMDIRPDYANIERDGELIQVDPYEVKVNDIIVVKPGERIALDGIVMEGNSSIDTSALTGESVPRDAYVGAEVISGCINQSGKISVKVTKEFGESTVSKILDLVENSSSKKSKSENFITKFARYYTPAVVGAAVVLAILPPIILQQSFLIWIERALTFLVISCPCALVISIPLSFFGGIGGASKHGILIKGSNYLEALAKVGVVVFDKTGTLTQGSFNVTAIHPAETSEQEVLHLATLAESYSNHPISRSLKEAWGKEIDKSQVSAIEEIAGHGIIATIGSKKVAAGNMKLMDKVNAKEAHECHLAGTAVHVAVDGVYQGHIIISDVVKSESKKAIENLKKNGVHKTVMLTGDAKNVGESVANALGLDEVYAELLPGDKVEQVERLLAEKSKEENLAFVGDGINDAPVLTRADIGIAMGALGSDAAIEAADIVLMDDNPSKIATAIGLSRKTLRIVHQNIVFALGVKAIVLVLGAFGIANMWAAVFADVGVSVIAILNAIRALNYKEK